jgi:glutamine amidotransferase
MTSTSSPPAKAKATVAVIDYGMGNLRSVLKAWEHEGARVTLVDRPVAASRADALVFPGQGAIVDTMELLERTGFDHLIQDWIAAEKPFFGICLGLQALFDYSEEGDTPCLGIFRGQVERFRFPPATGLKVPHMGWNRVHFTRSTPVEAGLPEDPFFYFVHSYRVKGASPDLVWGETQYGDDRFCSAIQRGNCFATQFHPEKSQQAGLHLYRNFLGIL